MTLEYKIELITSKNESVGVHIPGYLAYRVTIEHRVVEA